MNAATLDRSQAVGGEMDDPRVAQAIDAEHADTYTVVVARAEEAMGLRFPGYAAQVERAVLITAAME